MSLRTLLIFAAVGAATVWSPAVAVPLVGTSSGTFSNLSGCDKAGPDRECGIVSSSQGNKTQVRWPYLEDGEQISGSTLTAIDVAVSTATDADDLLIGKLEWHNAATDGAATPDDFRVKLTLKIAFTQPNVSVGSEAFSLSIFNTSNPTGDVIDGFTLADLSHLSFNLAGWTVDDFRYSVVDDDGSCYGPDSMLTGSSWYNCENNTASLLITADFTDTTKMVGEPATLALLGAGLLGLAVSRRRKTASAHMKSFSPSSPL